MDNSFDALIASFFDVNLMGLIRNSVMMRHPPDPYHDLDIAFLGPSSVNLAGELQLVDYTWEFLHKSEPPIDEEDSRRLYTILQKHTDDIEFQILDLLHRGTFYHFIWPEQASAVWTVDRHHYGLLRHVIDGIDIYFILHLTKRTIAYIDRANMIDYAILKLLRADVPVYTEFPWPTYNLEERLAKLRGNIS